MKNLSLALLALLFSSELTQASRLNIQQGHCPHAPGSLKAKGLHGKDMKDLLGAWFTIIHEKSVPDVMGCIGTHYQLEENTGKVRITKSGELSAAAKEQMKAAYGNDEKGESPYSQDKTYFKNTDLASDFRF